jgi:hypothetical protein
LRKCRQGPTVVGVHDPPDLKVGNGLLNDVADLVDLRVELFLPVQGLWESPEAYQAWIDGAIKPNLAPAENSSMLVGAVVRAEPTLYAIAVGGTLM